MLQAPEVRRIITWICAVCCLAAATLSQAQSPKPRRLAVTPEQGPLKGQTVYTNSYALLVGINRYANLPKTNWLEFADKDVKALRETLVRSYGFPSENIITLIDSQATRDNIRNALAYLTSKKRVQPTDRILLYFASHGQAVSTPAGGKEGFLIPHDAQVDLAKPTETLGYFQSCLPMRDLWAYVESCPARHSLVIVDACFGGLLARSRGGRVSEVSLSKYLSRNAYQFLTAGGKDEEVWEDPALGHSVFMHSLLKQLDSQAAQADSTFTAAELYSVLKTDVTDKSHGKQTPQMESHAGSEGEVVFVSTRKQPVPALVSGLPSNTTQEERPAKVQASERIGKSIACYARKEYKEAERLLKEALQVDPKDAYAYNCLGIVYIKTAAGYERIEECFRKAIELNPKLAVAYNNLGLLNQKYSDYEPAELMYKRAIEADPNLGAAYENLGSLLAEVKMDFVNAEPYLKKAIEINPKDPFPYFNLALVYYEQKKMDDARAQARKAWDLGFKDHPLFKTLDIH